MSMIIVYIVQIETPAHCVTFIVFKYDQISAFNCVIGKKDFGAVYNKKKLKKQ